MLSELRFAHEDVSFTFVALTDRPALSGDGLSPGLSSMFWLEPYAKLLSVEPELLCCDQDALRAYCALISRRHIANTDLHAFERRDDHSVSHRLLRRFYDDCDSPIRRWCVLDCTPEDSVRSIGAIGRSLTSLIHESEPRLPAAAGPTHRLVAPRAMWPSQSADTQMLDFPARSWPVDVGNSAMPMQRPASWWLLQSATCCDAQGNLIVHAHDPADPRVVGKVAALNGLPTLPSSTSLGTKSMPLRAYSEPYDPASCVHIRNWTFVTMHGLCPSAEFKSGNYAHSLVDALAPMFYTLQLLAPVLGPASNDHLIVSQCADPPRRHEPRPTSNCEVVAQALGFKRRALHWDDFAMGRRRYCFSSLIIGIDMNMALAGTYMSQLTHDDKHERRVQLYTGFARFIQVATTSLSSAPIASNSSVRAALAVRVQSRRLLNEAEVCVVMARLLGSAPRVVAFERMSMRQMVEALAPIQLMVGMFSSGMTNSMFMSSRGALPDASSAALSSTASGHANATRGFVPSCISMFHLCICVHLPSFV
jgi:hypothetical protein